MKKMYLFLAITLCTITVQAQQPFSPFRWKGFDNPGFKMSYPPANETPIKSIGYMLTAVNNGQAVLYIKTFLGNGNFRIDEGVFNLTKEEEALLKNRAWMVFEDGIKYMPVSITIKKKRVCNDFIPEQEQNDEAWAHCFTYEYALDLFPNVTKKSSDYPAYNPTARY